MNSLKSSTETIDIMTDKEVCTVDTFKKVLDALSNHGYGNMPIFVGNDTPLLNDSIGIDYMRNKLLIRNTYYNKRLVDAASKLKDSIDKSISGYINDCYHAGMEIKEDKRNE